MTGVKDPKLIAAAKIKMSKGAVFKEGNFIDLYGVEKDLENALRDCKLEMSPENWNLVERYNKIIPMQLSITSVRNEIRTILQIHRVGVSKGVITKCLSDFDKEEVNALSGEIRRKWPKNYEKNTDNTYQSRIKVYRCFMRWVFSGYRNVKQLNKLRQREPEQIWDIEVPQSYKTMSIIDLLDEGEKRLMLERTTDLQERALVATYSELGTRTAEILTRKRKHVKFYKNKVVFLAVGKTGMRDIEMYENVKVIFDWFNANKSASGEVPIFIQVAKNYGKRMTYDRAMRILKASAKRAEITKNVTFQKLRHGAATKKAGMVSEQALKDIFGWTPKSTTHSQYMEWSKGKTSDELSKAYGVSDKADEVIELVKCRVCGHNNNHLDERCEICMVILSAEQAQRESNEDKERVTDLEKKLVEQQKIIEGLKDAKGFDESIEKRLAKLEEKN